MLEIDKLYLGDCLSIMSSIDDKSIDLILCDLPYAVTSRNEWDIMIPFDKMWEVYSRVIKDNGAIVLTAIQPFASMLVASNYKMFKYEWIWKKTRKTNFLNAKKQPLRNHEQILVFYKNQPIYNAQGLVEEKPGTISKRGDAGSNYNDSGLSNIRTHTNYPSTVLEFASDAALQHPTQKPIPLFEYLINTYTNPGDLVLDNCVGSGTTCLAARNLDRHFIGIEKEQKYFEIALNRLL